MENGFEQTIQRAYQLAASMSHELVTLEHLLASLLDNSNIQKLIKRSGGNLDAMIAATSEWLNDEQKHVIVKQGSYQPRHTSLLAQVIKKAKTHSLFSGRRAIGPEDIFLAMYDIHDSPASWIISQHAAAKEKLMSNINRVSTEDTSKMDEDSAIEILETYCINLNDKAEAGRIDPLIGREREVEHICQIMSRRNKHNVIMTGDPGVGKTIIVEGLAKRITEGDVPDCLMGHTIWNLDVASLIAGTKFRGDFEERMKHIISAFTALPEHIMFIDEIHMIMGAGSGGGGSGSIDVANMLKPALSRGDIRCIGSTTSEEYRKHFEKDRALMRRFQRVTVDEPTPELSVKIIKGIRKYYEQHHNVKITDAAIDQAVKLSMKYMNDKKLPDKAIDIIDCAAARYKIKDAVIEEGMDQIVDVEQVTYELSKMINMPLENVAQKESKNLADLENGMKSAVFGQDQAVDNLLDKIFVAQAGMKTPNKPIGSFLFLGPTGCGKTETARQLSEKMSMPLVRFDMSEYQEKHSVARLIGAPPGYVGYEDNAGQLITKLQETPNCVLLLDEIEKAHPDVSNILLQFMDNGFVTGSNGKQADGRNCILVMTSNLGARDNENNTIGFGDLAKDGEEDKAIKKFFAPEFRNRLDAVIKFTRLSQEVVVQIVKKFVGELNSQLKDKGIEISVNTETAKWLAAKGYDKKMGARPLARLIDNKIKSPLSRRVLFGDLKEGGLVKVNVVNDDLDFVVEEIQKPLTKAERKAMKHALALPADTTNAET